MGIASAVYYLATIANDADINVYLFISFILFYLYFLSQLILYSLWPQPSHGTDESRGLMFNLLCR